MLKVLAARPGYQPVPQGAQAPEQQPVWLRVVDVIVKVVQVIGILSLFIHGFSVLSSAKTYQRDDCNTFVGKLAEQIQQPFAYSFAKGTLIQRKEPNETLGNTLNRSDPVVVLGQRQAGKTVLVQSHLQGKNNIYHYEPQDGNMLGNDAEAACGNEHVRKHTLVKALRQVQQTADEPAMVVFEIGHNLEGDAVTGIYESMKHIVYDAQLPHTKGILVLSNNYAIDAFPADRGRYETVWVGDLTHVEATAYLEIRLKKNKPLADEYTKALNTSIGHHMTQLQRAVVRGSLKAWAHLVEGDVRTSARKRGVRKIMQKLPHTTEGVPWQQLDASETDGDHLIAITRQDTARSIVFSTDTGRFH